MGLKQKRLKNNESGIAFIVWAIVLIAGAVASLGVYQITQRPDITYNITDTGFSFAGIDMSWLVIIAIAVVLLFLFMFMFRKKPQQQQQIQPYYRNGRY